jgi:hypothetical protein
MEQMNIDVSEGGLKKELNDWYVRWAFFTEYMDNVNIELVQLKHEVAKLRADAKGMGWQKKGATSIDDFMTREEFARKFGITVQHAAGMACKRVGPKVTKIGKFAYYHRDDVAKWLDSCRK